MSQVTLGGNPIDVAGTFPAAGAATDFTLVGKNLGNLTPTCATSTRKFNVAAAGLDNTVVVVVSGDLPFAATRFCTAEGIENVVTASTFRGHDFAKAYASMSRADR